MPAFNFKARFADIVSRGEKRQTIRKVRVDGRPPAKVGDTLTLYTGMRTKACRRLFVGRCVAVLPVVIGGRADIRLDGLSLGEAEKRALAQADGFADVEAFVAFFDEVHGLPFIGWVIRWGAVED